jgi:hypothetical protein
MQCVGLSIYIHVYGTLKARKTKVVHNTALREWLNCKHPNFQTLHKQLWYMTREIGKEEE